MALTDTRIRTAKADSKPIKLADGNGLYLEIRPNGTKLWRYRYRIAGKENLFALGAYPEIGLSAAREKQREARKLVKQGIHPAHQRKLDGILQVNEHANTFRAVAEEWLAQNKPDWTPRTYEQRRRLLDRDILPAIGNLPIRQVVPAHILDILKRIEKRAPTFAVIARQAIGSIFSLAIVTLRAETEPTAPLRRSLKPHKAATKDPLAQSDLPGFMAKLEIYAGHFSNKVALKFLFLTLARSNEVLGARWDEIDLDKALWRIPAERMKMREAHTIPLQRQAVELLQSLQGVTGKSPCLFPSRSNFHRPASLGLFGKIITRMGYAGRFTPHGIRVTGSTILNEMGFRSDIIERQLAHTERNKTRAAYNRAEYLAERREMMQTWGDLIEEAERGNSVVVPGRFGHARGAGV